MKKLLLLICYSALFFACNRNKNTTPQASLAKPDHKINVIDSKNNTPEIRQLPFAPKPKDIKDVKTYESSFYAALADNEPTLKLPHIKSAQYVLADKEYGTGLCYDNPDSKSIKPVKYKYRLPDHKGFQVYYMTGDAGKSQDLAEEFGTTYSTVYGNLIVYDPKTQSAQVLTVYYSFYIDSQQERFFYIKSDYTIYMADESVSGGEEGADAPSPGKVYRAVINDTGGFTISIIFSPY